MEASAPFLVRPRYLAKPWGGRRLATALGRADLPAGPVGESWEAGVLPDWDPRVETGPLAGARLGEVWPGPFPLLCKVIDAREDLSVQVHPDGLDGPPAKEEAWVGLADGGAVACGRVDPDDLPAPGGWLARLGRRALGAGGATGPPDLVHVPPGAVHAVLAGTLLWEVQTPVDLTWRLDDHGRAGLDGRPRPLHLERARGVLARGGEPEVRLADGGRALEARRLFVALHPPGTWDAVPGCALFLPAGGVLVVSGARGDGEALRVPPGRTALLPPGRHAARSPGWMCAAGPRPRAS